MDIFKLAGQHAKWVLALGLVAAIFWPAAAEFLSGYLIPLIMIIMFVGTLRLAPQDVPQIFQRPGRTLIAVLTLQLVLPVTAALGFWVTGTIDSTIAAAVVIALSASGIVSSPNIAAIMGLDGPAALRFFGMGTLVVPLTCLPPLLLLFGTIDAQGVFLAAGRLALILIISGGAGLLCRRMFLKDASAAVVARLDGISAIALSVFVLALMPAFTSTALSAPMVLAGWLLLAFGLNFGLQTLTYRFASKRWPGATAGSLGLIAGNRNMALFFAALPPALTTPLLPYLAAYQVPMYLTPLLLGWLYSRTPQASSRRT